MDTGARDRKTIRTINRTNGTQRQNEIACDRKIIMAGFEIKSFIDVLLTLLVSFTISFHRKTAIIRSKAYRPKLVYWFFHHSRLNEVRQNNWGLGHLKGPIDSKLNDKLKRG